MKCEVCNEREALSVPCILEDLDTVVSLCKRCSRFSCKAIRKMLREPLYHAMVEARALADLKASHEVL